MSIVDTNNGVGIILVDRQGRFLLQLRDEIQGIAWPGIWGIVGGAMEVGESPYEAAIRETEEEVGQRIEQLHLVGAIPNGRGGTLHLFCGGAAFLGADIVVGEGQDARFFDPGDIRQLKRTTPFLKPLVSSFVSDPRYEQCMRDAGETS